MYFWCLFGVGWQSVDSNMSNLNLFHWHVDRGQYCSTMMCQFIVQEIPGHSTFIVSKYKKIMSLCPQWGRSISFYFHNFTLFSVPWHNLQYLFVLLTVPFLMNHTLTHYVMPTQTEVTPAAPWCFYVSSSFIMNTLLPCSWMYISALWRRSWMRSQGAALH